MPTGDDQHPKNSNTVKIRTEKKLLGRMSYHKLARVFVDERVEEMIDILHDIIELYTGSKKEADKIIKYTFKTVVKIGILYRHQVFSDAELALAIQLNHKCIQIIRRAVRLYERRQPPINPEELTSLANSFFECNRLLQRLVESHLHQKSLDRINHVFHLFTDERFVRSLFSHDEQYGPLVDKLIRSFNVLLAEGLI